MNDRSLIGGNAMIETVFALLALTPFIAGVALLGKQLDVKQKTYDAARYSVWERTIWRNDGASNRKQDADISLEARDRILGDPRAPLTSTGNLRAAGITENPLWHDGKRQRLLDYNDKGAAFDIEASERRALVEVGYSLVPGIAHGAGVLGAVEQALQLDDLNLNRYSFVHSTASVGLRPLWRKAQWMTHSAGSALLSDTWSARDENTLRRRIDDVTADELLGDLELPGRPLGMQALEKGKALYGEGQFGWSPDLRPRSNTLPAAYIARPAQ